MPSTSNLLAEIGAALFGPRWQSEMARLVGVSDRTMRRWASDPHEMPDGVLLNLNDALGKRTDQIEKLQNRLNNSLE